MFYCFTTTPTSPNPYITCTVDSMNLIMTLNKGKKRLDEKTSQNNLRIENYGRSSTTDSEPHQNSRYSKQLANRY